MCVPHEANKGEVRGQTAMLSLILIFSASLIALKIILIIMFKLLVSYCSVCLKYMYQSVGRRSM